MVPNPVHVFKLVKRTLDLEADCLPYIQGKEDMNLGLKSLLIADIYDQISKHKWCTKEDLVGCIHGLVRPQYAYYLSPLDMARGKLGNIQTLARLSAEDCLQIGEDRISGKHPVRSNLGPEYASGIEWLEASLVLATEKDGGLSEQVLKISQVLQDAKAKHDAFYRVMTSTDTATETPNEEFFIRTFSSAKEGEILNSRKLREEEHKEFSERISLRKEDYSVQIRNFNTVCRGEPLKYADESDRHVEGKFCYLTDNGQPYLKLAPAKIEIILEEPPLYMYHHALTEAEMELMKTNAAASIDRSGLYNATDPNNSFINNDRTQSNSWLWDESNEQLHKMSQRLDLFTKLHVSNPKLVFQKEIEVQPYLDVETSEAWQIGAYGPGGLYLPHYDALGGENVHHSRTSKNEWVGNRIATAMVYLSNVEGGGTGFPILGKATFPTKGSFAFWFNLHRNGDTDMRTLHGACPTIFGIKWVSNKWIREGTQLFKRPCHLRKDL